MELGGVGIRSAWVDGKTSDGVAVQPGFDGTIGTQVILETLPGAGGKRDRGGGALWGHVGHGSIVGLAVVHQDLVLATKAEMLAGALGGVRHGEEGNVVRGQSVGGSAVRE